MTDFPSDDARLRATEAHMRRALGLTDASPARPQPAAPQVHTTPTHHPQRRRFVRDGDVPVTVLHRESDDGSGSNKLDAARQALRDQTAAREHAEQLLQEAQAAARDLQTKLAHERLAWDEARERAETEARVLRESLQAARDELANERAALRQAEQERDAAIAGERAAEARLRDALARPDARPREEPETAGAVPAADGTPRRRGRPPKHREPEAEAEFVEWWKPGWREQYR